MSDFKHRTPICEHCGAAYTPHTRECPMFGQQPPARLPSEPTMTNAAVARNCFMPSPQQPITMDTIRDAVRSMKKPRAPEVVDAKQFADLLRKELLLTPHPSFLFAGLEPPASGKPARIEQTIEGSDDPDRIWHATAKALEEVFKGE